MGTRPLVVRQGQYWTSIAAARGFDADAVWSHPDNEELRQRRPNREMLAPGDIVYVPDRQPEGPAVSLQSENNYQARVPRTTIRLVLVSEGRPLANEQYIVEMEGRPPLSGATDGGGALSFEAPVTVHEALLRLPGRGTSQRVLVGHMDPPDEMSGVRARLTHLGYLTPSLRGTLSEGMLGSEAYRDTVPEPPEDALESALRAFQRARGLPPTGVADETTRQALSETHDGGSGS